MEINTYWRISSHIKNKKNNYITTFTLTTFGFEYYYKIIFNNVMKDFKKFNYEMKIDGKGKYSYMHKRKILPTMNVN